MEVCGPGDVIHMGLERQDSKTLLIPQRGKLCVAAAKVREQKNKKYIKKYKINRTLYITVAEVCVCVHSP